MKSILSPSSGYGILAACGRNKPQGYPTRSRGEKFAILTKRLGHSVSATDVHSVKATQPIKTREYEAKQADLKRDPVYPKSIRNLTSRIAWMPGARKQQPCIIQQDNTRTRGRRIRGLDALCLLPGSKPASSTGRRRKALESHYNR